jgi:hypothetical protein
MIMLMVVLLLYSSMWFILVRLGFMFVKLGFMGGFGQIIMPIEMIAFIFVCIVETLF